MKNIIILTSILVYWFLLGTSLFYFSQDPVIAQELSTGNQSFDVFLNTSNMNITTVKSDSYSSPAGLLDVLALMFGFRTPDFALFPKPISLFIGFINFILVIIGAITVYRLALPTSGE